jgi:hypothetical protein
MNLKETGIHIDICAIDNHVLLICCLNRPSLKHNTNQGHLPTTDSDLTASFPPVVYEDLGSNQNLPRHKTPAGCSFSITQRYSTQGSVYFLQAEGRPEQPTIIQLHCLHLQDRRMRMLYLLPASCWFLAWLTLRPWRWKECVPPKRLWTLTGLCGITSQNKIFPLRYHLPENFKSVICLKQNVQKNIWT